jgi:hypothetical protein
MSKLQRLQKFLPVGTLGISLILHLTVFLGISGIIIIQAVVPKIIPAGDHPQQLPASDIPPPPELPDEHPPAPNPSAPDDAALEARPIPAFSIDQISSAGAPAAPAFNIVPPSALPVSPGAAPQQPPENSARTEQRTTVPKAMSNPFGDTGITGGGALIGTLYDLKQTADRKPSPMAPDTANGEYQEFVRKFVTGGWNLNLLAPYYKVEKTIGSYQIYIPSMDAGQGPAAFKADRYVKPNRWIVIYTGHFTAPADGTYRFIGMGDDMLVVRLNKRNVLDGCLSPVLGGKRGSLGKPFPSPRTYQMYTGDWFTLTANQSYPIDILIGECPGSRFNAYLLIQQKDVQYEPGEKGFSPALPVFQTQSVAIPKGPGPAITKEQFITK